MTYHISPIKGTIGKCKAQPGNCPFGAEEEHYESQELAQKAFELKAIDLEDSGQVWPPPGLPKKYHAIATGADLIRHFNDSNYEGAEGICLGISSFISHLMIQKSIDHKLVRGVYITENGEEKSHWWVESRGWIFDASRGQFKDSSYRSGVVKHRKENYSKLEEFEPGHESLELVEQEIKGCFGDPHEAEAYLYEIQLLQEEAEGLSK